MAARYIVRLDDACHCMDRAKWAVVEALLDEFDVKPVVAVVPDNQDPRLNFDRYDTEFWQKVRTWQAKGWCIALHGYQHTMHPTRAPLLVPFHARSEFAELSLVDQQFKLERAVEIFKSEGVSVEAWIAPAHGFDQVTLEALRNVTNIRIVSDGIATDKFVLDGLTWIPQQLWEFKPRRYGLWTVCLHPNTMVERDLSKLRDDIVFYRGNIASIKAVMLEPDRKLTIRDRSYAHFFWAMRRLRSLVGR